MNTQSLFFGIISSLLLFFVGTGLLSAGTGLTIQPVKISHTLEKGATAQGYISLSNASEEDVQVDLKIEDFVPNAGGDGIKFVSRAEGLTTVRDWIVLNDGNPSIILKQDEKISIPYVIRAPANAEPGSHFGVAFFKATKLSDAEQQLKIGTQVGTLIFVTIPGNFLQKGNILSFAAPRFVQKSPVTFTTRFENTGTVHFEPKGTIVIKNIFGKKVADVPVEGQVVLPTGIKDLQTSFVTDGFLLGRYTAAINLVDGEGQVLTTESVSFYAFPVWYILSFIGVLVLVYFLLKFIRSKFSISINVK